MIWGPKGVESLYVRLSFDQSLYNQRGKGCVFVGHPPRDLLERERDSGPFVFVVTVLRKVSLEVRRRVSEEP